MTYVWWRLSSEPPHFRIGAAAEHRPFDVAPGQPNIAQLPIVQLGQRLDRGPALPKGREPIGPDCNPADQSADQIGKGGLRGTLRDRGHFYSPTGARRQSGAV